ncbi:DMT family transporter [Streptomyces sp. NBC_00083]|uniref:DMT family transporter n=1 Tax=Streptomyces sp. NBC_00083 TaxID=2975647 RepID=UPI0022555DD4|nr:DMT family transporter [Streptomyces sp. NBC_00083]MCX5384377.1 DMT family transporter [Streptomyces sp. NBC_00083]
MTTTTAARRAWLTDLPVLLVAVVWGSSYLAAKGVTTTHTVLAVLVLRFAVVLPVLVVAGWRRLRALSRPQLGGAGLLGLILSGIFLLETYGVVQTSATNAGLIISLTMIFTPVAESRLRRTPLSRSFLAAAGLSVLGVVLLTQGAGFTSPSLGDLLMLGAAVARTVHVLAMSRLRSVRGADALSLTTVQLGSAVGVFAVLSAAPGTGGTPWAAAADFGAGEWLGLLYLSAFCTLFAFFVQMWAVRRTSPSRVSLLLGTEPVWAAVVGIALAGDRPGWLGFLGALLVLAGTAWGRTAAPRERETPDTDEVMAPGGRSGDAAQASPPDASVVQPSEADGADAGLETAVRA